jgi:glycosyltransferase involved in cell wall biosynthesis
MVTSRRLILCSTHLGGNGAGIAASRWIKALKIETCLKKRTRPNLIGHAIQRSIEKLLWNEKLINSYGPASMSLFGSQKLNQDKGNVFFIHWVQGGFISIWQLFKTRKKSIFYLHDQWMCLPLGHYKASGLIVTYVVYPLNTVLYLLKKQIMRDAKGLIVPSIWLRDQLLRINPEARVSVIPNPVPTEYFQSYDKLELKFKYGIAADCKVVIFSTTGGQENIRKGNHLFESFLSEMNSRYGDDNFKILVIGSTYKLSAYNKNVEYFPFTNNESVIAEIIAMADVCISLSQNDNFPQFTSQSQCLGVRVVSFDVGGCKETIVNIGTSGFIVKNGNISKMVDKTIFCFDSETQYSKFQKETIQKLAFDNWSEESIAKKFEQIIGSDL